MAIVGHNLFFAEVSMLNANFDGFLGKRFDFPKNNVFDTGALEKASRAIVSDNPKIRERADLWLPQPDDTLTTYFRRVVKTPAKGIFWNLGECAKKYGIDKKLNIKPEDMHSAKTDALVTHHLMEAFRSQITTQNQWSGHAMQEWVDDRYDKAHQHPPRKAAGDRTATARRRGQRNV